MILIECQCEQRRPNQCDIKTGKCSCTCKTQGGSHHNGNDFGSVHNGNNLVNVVDDVKNVVEKQVVNPIKNHVENKVVNPIKNLGSKVIDIFGWYICEVWKT